MYEKSCSIFKLTYEIKGESIIKLFDEGFAQDPKISCKMIIDNKLYLLSDKYQIFDYNQKFLKVKLLIMNKEKINLSYMFYECYSLKNFSVLSHGENNLEDILKNKKKVVKNTTINENDSNESSGQFFLDNNTSSTSKKVRKNINENKTKFQRNKLNLIFIFPKKNISSIEEKEKIQEVVNQSHNFLLVSSSYYSFEFNNNNFDENNLIKEPSLATKETEVVERSNNPDEKESLFELYNILGLSL